MDSETDQTCPTGPGEAGRMGIPEQSVLVIDRRGSRGSPPRSVGREPVYDAPTVGTVDQFGACILASWLRIRPLLLSLR